MLNCSSIIYYSELPWSTRQILQFSSKWRTGTTMNSPEMQIFELQFHYILNNYYLWKQILQSSSKNHYQYLSGEYSDQVLSLSWWRVLILQWDNSKSYSSVQKWSTGTTMNKSWSENLSCSSIILWTTTSYQTIINILVENTQTKNYHCLGGEYWRYKWDSVEIHISDYSLLITLNNHYLQMQPSA